MEDQNNNPSFTWQGNTYNFIPSIVDFTRQDLDAPGGYRISRLMTATIRLNNIDCDDTLTPVFANGYPQPKQIITYTLDGQNYRIQSVKPEKTGAYIRIIADSTTKGL